MSQFLNTVRPSSRRWPGPLAAACALVLSGCGGGGSAGAFYTVAGSVSSLGAGKTVVLQLNAGDDLSVAANGSFAFPNPVAAGTHYTVTVKTASGGQVCRVSHGSGIVNAQVSDVAVSCGAAPASGVPALVGDWVMVQCTAVSGSSSARTLIRVTQTAASTFEWGQGLVQYASANCIGAGTVLPVVRVGSVQVTDMKSSFGIAAHWGRATLVTQATRHGVWAKRSDTELCLVGDENPTLFATADAVLSAIEVAPSGMCYTALRP